MRHNKSIVIKEVVALVAAFALVLILSRTLFSASSPAIQTGFIAQLNHGVQTFLASALQNGSQARTEATGTQGNKLRPTISVRQVETQRVLSVSFPKDFTYTLENGVYR